MTERQAGVTHPWGWKKEGLTRSSWASRLPCRRRGLGAPSSGFPAPARPPWTRMGERVCIWEYGGGQSVQVGKPSGNPLGQRKEQSPGSGRAASHARVSQWHPPPPPRSRGHPWREVTPSLTFSAPRPAPGAASSGGRWSWCSCPGVWSALPISGGTGGVFPRARRRHELDWAAPWAGNQPWR